LKNAYVLYGDVINGFVLTAKARVFNAKKSTAKDFGTRARPKNSRPKLVTSKSKSRGGKLSFVIMNAA